MKTYITQPTPKINSLLLIGAGLIGGSLTLALKHAGVVRHVIGSGRSATVMDEAVRLGVVDVAVYRDTPEFIHAVKTADVIVLAMPVGQTRAVCELIAPHIQPDTLITDVGSTKTSVYNDAHAALGDKIAQFVLAHPIAGREVNGPAAALADLYVNKKVMICPHAHNHTADIDTIAALWQATGANVYELSLAAHDEIFAAVSHLPHVLAYALMNHVADSDLSTDKFAMAGAGFRDFTRIAAASPEMWRDVCLANKDAILAELDGYLKHAQELREMIAVENSDEMLELFKKASSKRLAWGKEK
ncbi:Prephenate dehydrogenase [Ephemeroptericola cinctiostellae]|uniref:prephenate dehydrogenase n=1 Tax=Ephemeroptericola cinctiostellae TaxID=2268024 RepID=A0A345D8D2_9BURK|nr:prephenate dehydrogenase/arogenate dehydrogenase family protein [Ephemeroptericola cinctiostellae]AXF84620.1 Prephenate dehydrogenase [Ephemeroptericola cinctiostellae]